MSLIADEEENFQGNFMKKQGIKKSDPYFDLASLQPMRELFHYFVDLPLVYVPASDPRGI